MCVCMVGKEEREKDIYYIEGCAKQRRLYTLPQIKLRSQIIV